MVVETDGGLECRFELSERGKGPATNPFGLQAVEERLDVGIVLGEAFRKALGDKKAIRRFGDFRAPLDEALAQVRVSLDISGRGSCHIHTHPQTKWISHPALRVKANKKGYTLADAKHFLESFAAHFGLTLHVDFISGEQPHHVIEATFKALAKALDWATTTDSRMKGVPSTKGKL